MSGEGRLLPFTTARTPVGILKAVVRAIREEPLRYAQGSWGQTLLDPTVSSAPVCGTVCCIAGWTAVVTRPQITESVVFVGGSNARIGGRKRTVSVDETARRLLKLTVEEANDLFDSSFYLNSDPDDISHKQLWPMGDGREGSPEYAEAGIAKIDRFMRRTYGFKGAPLYRTKYKSRKRKRA